MSLAVANIRESLPFILQRMTQPDGWFRKNQTLAPECHRQCTRIEPFLRLVVAVLSHLGEAFKSLLFSLYNEKVKFINF